MQIYWLAFSLFLLMDAIGNIPFYIALLKKISPKRQRRIILREMLIALLIIFLFNFLGNPLLRFLHVTQDTIQIAGGIILFLMSLKMIFPPPKVGKEELEKIKEPMIVPLAIPLIAGPAVLAAVILYAHQVQNGWVMIGAITLAWIASLVILLGSPYLSKKLGEKGVIAIERLMGLILVLISTEMFLDGVSSYMKAQS